jgi:hypothetical protein
MVRKPCEKVAEDSRSPLPAALLIKVISPVCSGAWWVQRLAAGASDCLVEQHMCREHADEPRELRHGQSFVARRECHLRVRFIPATANTYNPAELRKSYCGDLPQLNLQGIS